MSQYPWVYEPPSLPPRGYDPAAQLLAPARRAGILAMILGSMLLLCGVAAMLLGVNWERLPAEIRTSAETDLQRYTTADTPASALATAALMTAAVAILLVGVVMIVLGIFALRGGLGPIIGLMVIVGLLLLFLGYQAFGALSSAAGDPRGMMAVCIVAIPISLLGLLMWFLASAVRVAPQVWLMRMQQTPMWQHEQNRQMYQQGAPDAYGITPPPAPPPDEQSPDRDATRR